MIYITPGPRNNNPGSRFPSDTKPETGNRQQPSTGEKLKIAVIPRIFILPFISTETINHHLSTGHMESEQTEGRKQIPITTNDTERATGARAARIDDCRHRRVINVRQVTHRRKGTHTDDRPQDWNSSVHDGDRRT